MIKFFKNILLILLPAYFAMLIAKIVITEGMDHSFLLNPLDVINGFIQYITVNYTGDYFKSNIIALVYFVLPSYIALFIKLSVLKRLKKK